MRIELPNPKESWLSEYSKASTKKKYDMNFDLFCKWANTNETELVEEFKVNDPRDFSKKWGKILVQYFNDMIKEDLKINTARTRLNAPRAFFKSQCGEVRIKRGAIPKARMAYGEHEFTQEEFQKMFKVGDIEDKARLTLSLNLGWGASDVLGLQWEFIEPYLDESLEPPVAFWYEREKTGAPTRSHLTHEAITALRELRRIQPKTEHVFESVRTVVGLNKWLKSLCERAKIKTRGKVRFHLLRKYTFSQLSASGMNQWEAKLCVGKTIPLDILTYLKGQEEILREKYVHAEPRLTLSAMTNGNNLRLGDINEKIGTMEQIITDQERKIKQQDLKIDVLTRTLESRQQKFEDFEQIIGVLQKTIKHLTKSLGEAERKA